MNMNNKFDELTTQMAQSVSRYSALKKFRAALAAVVLTLSLALRVAAGNPNSMTASVSDAAGDAVFPYDLYNGPVPPWIDIVRGSVTLTRGVFHFEVQVNTDIPANGDPGFTPDANHIGTIFGILTDPKTAQHFHLFGQQDNYYFNFLVMALYVVSDDDGFEPGWHGFLQGPNSVIEIPLVIRGDTYILETSAASLGNPASFQWAIGGECDPVPASAERNRTIITVDYAPDHGLASWPAQ
jgi:hypothetical protein